MMRSIDFGLLALFCALAPNAASAQAPGAPPFAPPRPTPIERLNWYGDPGAPDISGVWMRAEKQAGMSPGDPEGWRPWPPPLQGKALERWQQRVADSAAGRRSDDPVIGCLPPGMPRFVTGDNSPLLIIQSHQRVTMMRSGEGARRIWLDGRPLPQPKDLETFYKGTAIGHYEGKDLVVESTGFADEPIDATGVPHDDGLRIGERYHRVDDGTLSVEVTLSDPDAYRQPLVTTVVYKKVADPRWEPQEFICVPKTGYHPERYVR